MTATATPKATAENLIHLLRRHYLPEGRPPGGIFAAEIQAPGSSRRADLIWQGVTAGAGYELIGHEVKVSRADLLTELADPTKSDPWMKYCNRWYLVLPAMAIADGLDLPDTWGVMTPPSGRRTRSMTVERKAPALSPHEQSPALRTIATWLHWRHHNAELHLKSAHEERDQLRKANEGLQIRARGTDGRKSPLQRVAEQIVSAVGIGYGDRLGDDWNLSISADDVIAELREVGAIRARSERLADRIKYDLSSLRTIRDGCDSLLKQDSEKSAGGGG